MKKIYTTIILAICFTAGAIAQAAWLKHEDPILTPETDMWDEGSLGMPAVLLLNGTYHMWYSGGYWNVNVFGSGLQIGHATSADGITWQFDANNPVIQNGEDGSFDDTHAYLPIVEYDENTFHMYYVGNDGEYKEHLGYATSEDGSTWTKHPDKLIFEDTDGDPYTTKVNHGDVYYDGNKFHMWAGMSGGGVYNVGYANSEDGFTWVIRDSLVMDDGNSADWFYPRTQVATVFQMEHPDCPGKYHMWYSGGSMNALDIGYAYSDTAMNWRSYGDGSVLKRGGSGEWDASSVCFPTVMFDEDKEIFKMWFGGMAKESSSIGYAETYTVNVGNFALKSNLNVYPNPAESLMMLETEIPGSKILELYSVSGQVVYSSILKKAHTQIDVSSFEKGIYFVLVTNGKSTATRKVLIE